MFCKTMREWRLQPKNLSVYQLWYDPGKSEMSSSWIHSDWNPKQYSDKENSLLFLQGLLSCAFYSSCLSSSSISSKTNDAIL